MSVRVIRTLLHPGTLLSFLALLDMRLWCHLEDPGASHGCHRNSMTVVAMAAEDVIVPSNDHHSLNDVIQQSTEDNNEQADAQQTESNILEQGDGDTELSKSVQDVEEHTAIESQEQQVGVAEHTIARSGHAPTPCMSSNYLRDVIMQATESSFIKPTCSMEPRLEHVDPDLEIVQEPINITSTSELGEDDRSAAKAHGELSGMEDGVPGTEEGTAQPVEEEEATQDEDILTFEEFKQRRMMEVQLHQQEELKNSELPSNGVARGSVSNNYASLECGAKLIATNKEANNPKAILQENRDIYMLSPCSADIWFIVELCDTVLVHSIEIATFELFSSVPEVFAVYTSNRYPAIEWSLIGEFKARTDVRTVQTFPLDESVYAKYIKVEMISHFGSEHYCPLSLLRVLGTSFIQEYEDSEERGGTSDTTTTTVILDGTEHAPLSSEESQDEALNHSFLYVAAKDVVLNILEKVSNGLMGAAASESISSSDITSTHTLSLTTAGSTSTISSSSITTTTTASLPTGLRPAGHDHQEGNSTNDLSQNNSPSTNTPSIVPSSSLSSSSSSSVTMTDHVSTLSDVIVTTSSSVHSSIIDTIISSTPDDNVTTTVSNVTNTTHSDNVTYSTSSLHTTGDHTVVANPSVPDNAATESSHDADNAHHNSSVNATEGSGDPVIPTPTNTSDDVMVTSHDNSTEEEYDNGEEETFTDSLPTQPPLTIAGQQQQKSSVLIRLSNRIKELEVNMSLFGDYLERVRTSLQRNKNRTDELQRCIEKRLESLNDTVMSLRNETEISWVLLLQLHEDIQVLTRTAIDISQSLKLLQSGSVSWDHLIYEAILVVMVIAGYHAYYRNQWEAHMMTVMSKMIREIERSSRQSNHIAKSKDYHDDDVEYPYTRDTVEAHRRRKKATGSKLRQAHEK